MKDCLWIYFGQTNIWWVTWKILIKTHFCSHNHFKTFEFWMRKVHAFRGFRLTMSFPECFWICPIHKYFPRGPGWVRHISGMRIFSGALDKVEFLETRNFVKVRFTVSPHFFESIFKTRRNFKSIHRYVHSRAFAQVSALVKWLDFSFFCSRSSFQSLHACFQTWWFGSGGHDSRIQS